MYIVNRGTFRLRVRSWKDKDVIEITEGMKIKAVEEKDMEKVFHSTKSDTKIGLNPEKETK